VPRNIHRYLSFLLAVALVSCASTRVEREIAGIRCVPSLSRLLDDSPPRSPSELKEVLKKILKSELEKNRAWGETEEKALPQGSKLIVDSVEYVVVHYLGAGFEGTVYLVDGPTGRMAVKVFKGRTDISEHYKDLQSYSEGGVPTPKVWEVDPIRKTARLEYVEGIKLSSLLDEENAAEWGLTASEVKEFQRRLEKFRADHQSVLPYVLPNNILVDVNTGELVLIDPI
jgi:hypothetical protein